MEYIVNLINEICFRYAIDNIYPQLTNTMQ